jgi:tetratricopeptide (TPR) repeat protein
VGLALALASAAACGGKAIKPGGPAFEVAVEATLDKKWRTAARAAWTYLRDVSVEDDRYDRALMLVAQACEKLGLSYPASLWYLDIARSGRNDDLLGDAVAGLERIVMGGPHDEITLVRGYLATADLSGLRPELQAFIDYQQGLDSIRRGLDQWADQQLARVPDDSPYFFRVKYLQAVRLLARSELAGAREALEALAGEKRMPTDLRNDVRLALARLAMEEERYEDAVEGYEKVRYLAPGRPSLLLEMAWARFYRGDSRRALGLLIALDAPAYRGLIAPERYLLEALCLRRLCQFEPARIAAVRLAERHGDALADIHAGVNPMESVPIRSAAQQRGAARDTWKLLRLLRHERARVRSLSLGGDLRDKLTKLYDIGIAEVERRLDEEIQPEIRDLVQELVRAEDGVRLILHELSVGLLRGRERPAGPLEVPGVKIRAGGDTVMYRFEGEFWTDEIDDLVVTIPDRCLDQRITISQ